MRTTLLALLHSLTRRRPLGVALVAGAAYAAAAIALPQWDLFHGLPGMRPALALLVVLAVLGGAPAAVGGLLGGLAIGLASDGPLGRGILPALGEGLASLLLGLTAWKAGWLVRERLHGIEEGLRPRLGEFAWDVSLAAVFAGLAYTAAIAWAGEALRVHPFPYLAIVQGANSLLALVVLTFPLFLILHPIARAAGVVWSDPRGDAAKSGWARAGRAFVWAAVAFCATVGFVGYHRVAASLTALSAVTEMQPTIWLIQLPAIVVLWWGALTG